MSSGFVTEADIAKRRKVREELWKAQKSEGDPDEPPEEPTPDYRTLYDRLQEQRDKKQDDWDEAHRLKNMVRGLEDDEVDFLEFVDTTKIREEKRIKQEEAKALIDYRKKVAELQKQSTMIDTVRPEQSEPRKVSPTSKKASHISLLAGAVKRKSTDTDSTQQKKIKTDDTTNSNKNSKTGSNAKDSNEGVEARVVAVLPGLGFYTDSSDSECDSSDSDGGGGGGQHPRDLTGRIIRLQEKNC